MLQMLLLFQQNMDGIHEIILVLSLPRSFIGLMMVINVGLTMDSWILLHGLTDYIGASVILRLKTLLGKKKSNLSSVK